ncbi:MAG: hypothetical protein WC371_03495 [Parachlamydiales bacterium]
MKFSAFVQVVAADHFFDGSKENLEVLKKLALAYPTVQFWLYPYIAERMGKEKSFQQIGSANFWHSLSRLLGYVLLPKGIEYTLFLDADEIAEGRQFKQWLDTCEYKNYAALRPANYWYFRESCYRAKTWEDSAVLLKNGQLRLKALLQKNEREALFEKARGAKKRQVIFARRPLLHHYSWVRTKEQMLKKVRSWGHRQDCNWELLVEKEFLTAFQGRDFVHGYEFETVEPFYPIDLNPKFSESEEALKEIPNLHFLSSKEVLDWVKKSRGTSFF